MTTNDNKSYRSYLNKLVDQCNNTYHHSIYKNLFDADYFVLTEKIEQIHKLRNLKLMIELELLSRRIFLI